MSCARSSMLLACALASSTLASADPRSPGGHGHRSRSENEGSGWASYGYPYYETVGPDGMPVVYVPPRIGGLPYYGPPFVPAPMIVGPTLAGPLPSPRLLPMQPAVAPAPKKPDPARASRLVTYGDRLFRAGNVHRAAERYEQAARTDPGSAVPRVRLAQVAIVRAQFSEAANQFREAQATEPGWLAKANDIQSIYGEPADFAKQIAKLESHLQANPHDRDAWFVLGAQWYLSGRTSKAADVFLRLSDRRPDPTLAAFLVASQPDDRVR